MAKIREELVGKRFLSVSKSCKLKLSKISEWDWRAGVIRACTHADSNNPELQILVEYEDVSWQRREWIHVHTEQAFQILLVEHTLAWAPSNQRSKLRGGAVTFAPALTFEALVDEVGLSDTIDRPLEYLVDRSLEFHNYSTVRNYQDVDCLRQGDEQCKDAVRRWVAEQDGQRILCTTPSVLVGFRVQVYRSEGTTQWYTAVIVGYNDTTRELTVTDDTVLEEHSEDPSLVHILLLGEGVVESILRGENVGITSRRSRSSNNIHHQTVGRPHRREPVSAPTKGRKHNLSVSPRVLPPSVNSSPPQGLSSTGSPGRVESGTPSPTPASASAPLTVSCPTSAQLKSISSSERGDDEHAPSSSPLFSKAPLSPVSPYSPREAGNEIEGTSPLRASLTGAPSPPYPCQTKQLVETSIPGSKKLTPSSPEVDRSRESPSKGEGTSTASTISSNEGSLRKLSIRVRNDAQLKESHDSPEPGGAPDPIVGIPGPIGTTEPQRGVEGPQGHIRTVDSDRSPIPDKRDLVEDSRSPSQLALPHLPAPSLESRLPEGRGVSSDPETRIPLGDSVRSSLQHRVLLAQEQISGARDNSPLASLSNDAYSPSPAPPRVDGASSPVGSRPQQRETHHPVSNPSKAESPHLSEVVRSTDGDELESGPQPNSGPKRRHSTELSNGRVRPLPLLVGASTPEFLKGSAPPRQVIVLSSVETPSCCFKVENRPLRSPCEGLAAPPDPLTLVQLPSTGTGRLHPPPLEAASTPPPVERPLASNEEVTSRLLPPECSLSVSRVIGPPPPPSSASHPPVSDCLSILTVTSASSPPPSPPPVLRNPCGLAPAGGAVSGRAVTITATSGPAPQGASRVASPPSVSITAVVRTSPTAPYPPDPHHQLPPHHDGVAGPPQPLHHHHQQPPFGPLATAPRMDQGDGSSDSGVSVTERSVSRSSVLSDEVTPTPGPHPQATALPAKSSAAPPLLVDRKEPVKVWRNPAVLSQSELSVRHIHSLQHTVAMSQHYPSGVPSHIAPPSGAPQSAVAAHAAAHAPPPPHTSSLSHAIPPPLHYPGHHAPPPPLHLTPSLQPSISAAAALYAQQDVWKQLGHVSTLAPHAYAPLLPRHQEEFPYLDHHAAAREIEKQQQADRIQRERREAEAREKQAKEKMERERAERQRKERERKDRDERERTARRAEWAADRGNENDLLLVNKHFEDSLRLASQKLGRENIRQLSSDTHPTSVFYPQGLTNHQPSPATHLTHNQSLLISQQQQQPQPQQPQYHHPPPHHNQNKVYPTQSQKASQWSLPLKVDPRDHRATTRHQTSESLRKVKEPEQFVQESIFKAFRADDPPTEAHMKSHPHPPPAHTKPSPSDYSAHFGLMKDPKTHSIERIPYPLPHEKPSVIVQPDLKFDKVAQQHSGSPKQRPPERSSPYSSPSAPNHYKPYEPSPQQRVSTPHHPASLSPSSLSVELTKARQPVSSPHTIPTVAHSERYFTSGTKPPVTSPYQPSIVSGPLGQAPMHNVNPLPSKPSVSSPPPQMYGKPGITAGVPVCKMEMRPVQHPLPLTSKAPSLNTAPPPAHSGIGRNTESRPPLPTPHDHRVSHNRSPFDPRHYSAKSVATSSVSSTHPPRVTTTSPHVTGHPPHQPTQTQPLDLGTRDGGTSPTNRRRALTPTPQEAKRPRLETMVSSPLLSRVSEPSPLYPTAATTITTVENTVALANLQRVVSPLASSAHHNSSPSNTGGSKNTSVITNNSIPPTTSSTANATLPVLSSQTNIINLTSNPTPPSTPTVNLTSSNSCNPPENGSLNSTSNVNSRPSSQPPPSVVNPSCGNGSTRPETSPGASSKSSEPEKSTSPVPSVGGYVHKLKKAWLQRHTSGAETGLLGNSQARTGASGLGPMGNGTLSSTSTSTSSPATTKPSTSLSSAVAKPEVVKVPLRKPKLSTGMPNGHGQEPKDIDSSSSDSEDSSSSKMKRGKTKRTLKRTKNSDSNSDSDKESEGSEGSVKKTETLPMKQDTEPRRRRGRKPKVKPDKEENLKSRKSKDDTPNDPLQKPPVSQLKKTGESFLQGRSCYEVAPKLPKCRECRWTPHQRNKKMPNIFCRFYAFRRLRYTKNGQLAVAGFSDPVKDAFGEDLRLWVPDPSAPAPDLDCEMSKFLITHVGDQFCDLVQQEKEAMALHLGEDSVIAWKRVVQGVREMCDVCETTLFNVHWACSKCGFVVCIDCYKGRKDGTIKVWDCEDGAKERDKYSWLLCASRLPHEQDKLMLTQIIAGNALVELGKKIHEIRYKWAVPMYCGCPEANLYKEKEQEEKKLNGINKDLMKTMKKESKCDLVNGTVRVEKEDRIANKDDDLSNSPLNFFADVALSNDKRESETSNSDSDSDSDDRETQPSTLRELLTVRPSSKSSASCKDESSNTPLKSKEPSKKKAKLDTLDDVISCVIERDVDKDSKKDPMKVELKHFIRKYNYNRKGREPLPIRIMTKTESRLLYPNVPHSWLCDGKLLRLHDPHHKDNVIVFQDQWKRGQPIIVSGSGQTLNSDLWRPQSFSRDFGEVKNNLINCLTENIVPNQPMKKFWDGFEHYGKRLKDEKGQPMILKLKDWPPTDDFAEMLPSRFEDLMKGLPMGQYTRRNGSLNLAGRLPDCFVRPDLGPKMYIAYGSASYPNKASTNLHLDISDAVNVMCYVGVPKDVEPEDNKRETLKAIDEAGCDILTRQRVREKEEIPGALWHIYNARDADKIRDLLNKVAIERGKKLEPYHDPIHDQSWFLDGPLRERLYKEYAVEGYAIVQCLGDAVFIPAGAPHQVRNLQNCVKVAEDFVSPENVSHCFHLTQEFRHLSDTHSNHEDKLQIKNIIYHAMKDSIATLMAIQKGSETSKLKKEEAS